MALEETMGAPAGELDNMFKQYDQEDPNIEVHFSPEEISKMSEYEKKRLRNLKRNYLVMNALGNFEFRGMDYSAFLFKTRWLIIVDEPYKNGSMRKLFN